MDFSTIMKQERDALYLALIDSKKMLTDWKAELSSVVVERKSFLKYYASQKREMWKLKTELRR